MRLAGRVFGVECAVSLLVLIAMAVLGRFGMFGVANFLAEYGFLSPGANGGIPIPTTTLTVRASNVFVWLGFMGMVGAFFFIMIVSFESYTAAESGDGPDDGRGAVKEKPAQAERGASPGRPDRPGGSGGARPGGPGGARPAS